jgi:hypothetical protein
VNLKKTIEKRGGNDTIRLRLYVQVGTLIQKYGYK